MQFRNSLLFLSALVPAGYAQRGQQEVTLSFVS